MEIVGTSFQSNQAIIPTGLYYQIMMVSALLVIFQSFQRWAYGEILATKLILKLGLDLDMRIILVRKQATQKT